jgi:membrane protein DedA with SNARE-associated domain
LDPKQDEQLARQTRMVAVVVAVTMLGWLGAQWLGPKMGLAGRYALLVDLAALAAFFWTLVVIFQIWRKRRQD